MPGLAGARIQGAWYYLDPFSRRGAQGLAGFVLVGGHSDDGTRYEFDARGPHDVVMGWSDSRMTSVELKNGAAHAAPHASCSSLSVVTRVGFLRFSYTLFV